MSTAGRTVLVKCGDSVKPVVLDQPWKKEQMTQSLRERFELPFDVPVLLQIFDKEWDSYIDLEEDDVVPDRSRILCIIRPNVYPDNNTSQRQRPPCQPLHSVGFRNECHTMTVSPTVNGRHQELTLETSVRLPSQCQINENFVSVECVESNNQSVKRPGSTPGHLHGYRNRTDSGVSAILRGVERSSSIDQAIKETVSVSDDNASVVCDETCEQGDHCQSTWPKPYTLPYELFPEELSKGLESKATLTCSQRHILVECVIDSILRYTSCPSNAQKNEVISTVLTRYPYLSCDSDLGSDRWNQFLNERFKYVRRKLQTPEVICRKRKYFGPYPRMCDVIAEDEPVLKVDENSSLEMHVYPESDDTVPSNDFDLQTYNNPVTVCYSEQDVSISADRPYINTMNRDEILAQFENTFGNNPQGWPNPYNLPKQLFPPILRSALEHKRKLDSPKANLLIRCLSDDIQAHSIFPSVKQREEVVQCLVQEYPHLRDSSPTGWTFHYIKLSERFKNIRRKMSRAARTGEKVLTIHPDRDSSSPSPKHVIDTCKIKIERL